MSEEIPDSAWEEAMALPATRNEMVQAMQLIQAVLLSHAAHDAARQVGERQRIEETGIKAIEHTMEIGSLVRAFVKDWTGRDVGE